MLVIVKLARIMQFQFQMFPMWHTIPDAMFTQPGEQAGIMTGRAAGLSFHLTKWRRDPGIWRGINQHQGATLEAQILAHRKDYSECEGRRSRCNVDLFWWWSYLPLP